MKRTRTLHQVWRLAGALALLGGCEAGTLEEGLLPPDRPPEERSERTEGRNVETEPSSRRVRRMTADQFHRALQVATGERWSEFGRFAAAMGRADLVQVTEEQRDYSLTFEKFARDAALQTCRKAVRRDVQQGRQGTEAGVVLRHVTVDVRGVNETERRAMRDNLAYLLLRFLTQRASGDDDPRIRPWMELLTSELGGDEPGEAVTMADRWVAVCVGLATHPDFTHY